MININLLNECNKIINCYGNVYNIYTFKIVYYLKCIYTYIYIYIYIWLILHLEYSSCMIYYIYKIL